MDTAFQFLITDIYGVHPLSISQKAGFKINVFSVCVLHIVLQFPHNRRSSANLIIINIAKYHTQAAVAAWLYHSIPETGPNHSAQTADDFPPFIADQLQILQLSLRQSDGIRL